MPVTALDLVADASVPLDIAFDNDSVLHIVYRPSQYTGTIERVFGANMAMGRELVAHAYILAQLLDSWDLTYGDDETVYDGESIPAGETSLTVEHELGFKPKPSQIELLIGGIVQDNKERLKKINDATFDVVLDEASEDATPLIWTATKLGGQPVGISERYLARLPLPVLQRIWADIERSLFPNRRTFRR